MRKHGDYSIGAKRKGKPHHADSPHEAHGYKKSNKMSMQSAGAKRGGDNRIQDYPDAPQADMSQATGMDGGGSMSGAAPMGPTPQ